MGGKHALNLAKGRVKGARLACVCDTDNAVRGKWSARCAVYADYKVMAEKEKRLVQHNFKTTESEARIMRKKMDALGITNESAYMRALALNGYILKLDLPQIREMIRLLSNMTNNLNQIARRLNAQGQMYDTEMEEMLQKQDELWQMMRKLLSILERTG